MTKNLVFNKQIILAAGMIVFVVAALIGGTGAFFSDTESSTGNVFTAGSVSLEITDIAHEYGGDQGNAPIFDEDGFSFELDDIKPLDEGTVTYNLENGANQAHVCVLVENATVAPDANDTALASMLNFLSDGVELVTGVWQSLGTLDAEEVSDLAIDYCFGVYEGTGCELDDIDYNPAQNGQMVVDIDFYAVQTRNNEGFDCSSLNPQWTDEGTRTGGALSFINEDPRGNVLQLTTINNVDSRVRWTNMNLNYDLSTFTGVSYESKQVSANDAINGNASMRLFIDLDGNLATADVQEITYEPYYNIAAHNALNDASILPNTWQQWEATMADGKFWRGGFLGSEGGGGYATNFTLAQVLAAHGSAKVVGISLGMGTYNAGQVVLVDNLVVNGAPLSLEN